jgi:hypothetical protein
MPARTCTTCSRCSLRYGYSAWLLRSGRICAECCVGLSPFLQCESLFDSPAQAETHVASFARLRKLTALLVRWSHFPSALPIPIWLTAVVALTCRPTRSPRYATRSAAPASRSFLGASCCTSRSTLHCRQSECDKATYIAMMRCFLHRSLFRESPEQQALLHELAHA